MILLFQINPSASESALAVDHMRSFFECVLQDYYHHDVRTISAMMLERIADARQHGGGLSLPPESLFSLASRIEEQLASAKQCTPGGARTPGWQAGCQAGLLLTRVRRAWDIRSADRHGVPAGQGRGLSRAVQPGAAGAAEQFGEMQVVGGDASRPAQPDPRLLLATFNQQTAGVCHPTEASNHPTATSPATATSTATAATAAAAATAATAAGIARTTSTTSTDIAASAASAASTGPGWQAGSQSGLALLHTPGVQLTRARAVGQSHVYSFVPRRLVVFGEELRREQARQ